MNCIDISKLLYDFTKNEVNLETKNLIQEHLLKCDNCQAELKQLHALKELFANSNSEPSLACLNKITAQIEKSKIFRFNLRPIFAAAAAILIVSGLFLYSGFEKLSIKHEIKTILTEDYYVTDTSDFDSEEANEVSYIYENDLI